MNRPSDSARAKSRLLGRLLDARSGRPDDLEALEEYLRKNPQERLVADELNRLWDDIGRVPAPQLRLTPATRSRGLFADIIRPSRWPIPLAVVMASAALLAVPLLSFLRQPATTAGSEYAAGNTTRRLTLTDGSVVTLANRSAVTVQMTSTKRTLRLLRGEAFFEVAHDKSREFVVATGQGQTTAVGTAFDVRIDGAQTVVTVTEGTVRVAASGSDQGPHATRGQQVRYWTDPKTGNVTIGSVAKVDGRTDVDWASGFLRFAGTPLGEAITVVNRHSAKRLILADPTLAATPVFAILKVGEVDGLLAFVAAQKGVEPAAVQQFVRIESSD